MATQIVSVNTSVGKYTYTPEEIISAAHLWLKDNDALKEKFGRFLKSSDISKRKFALSLEEILTLDGAEARAKTFEVLGSELGVSALLGNLEKSKIEKEKIDSMVFVSCTCPILPSIDTLLIEQAGLAENISRIPIYQHGCAGGVVGLSLLHKLVQSERYALLSSVELCSLVFQRENLSAGQLVGSALFGDGSGTVIVGGFDKGLVITDAKSYLIPNTRHVMGYDIHDNGSHLRLKPELPSIIAKHIPIFLSDFLSQHQMTHQDLNWWLIHPGGVKILELLEQTFNLHKEQSAWSREILKQIGNLASASILFVLESFLNSKVAKVGDKGVIIGVGPGLTIELILFEQKED